MFYTTQINGSMSKFPLKNWHKNKQLSLDETLLNCKDFEGNKILEQLKCPICLEVPLGEIYQCRNGHTLCKVCSRKVKCCPQCRVRFEGEGNLVRVRALESILESTLESVKVPCPHKGNGCMEYVPRIHVETHVKECIYNGKCIELCKKLGYDCMFRTNTLSTDSAVKHFQKEHNAVVVNGYSIQLHIENFKYESENLMVDGIWTPVILDTEGSQFIVLTFFNFLDLTVSWASLKMNFEENDEYGGSEIELRIMNNSNRNRPLKWKVFATPLLELKDLELEELGLQRIPIKALNEKYVRPKISDKDKCKENGNLEMRITVSSDGLFKELRKDFEREVSGQVFVSKKISEIIPRKKKEENEMMSQMKLKVNSAVSTTLEYFWNAMSAVDKK